MTGRLALRSAMHCHSNGMWCSDCDQLRAFAKKASIRTVDLRSAVRGGHIDFNHVLDEQLFHQDMKAYVRGDVGSQAKKELQAGARAARMNKRNRS
jgi:hypothetical protein